MAIVPKLKPILHPRSIGTAPVPTGMVHSMVLLCDGVSQEHCVVSTGSGKRISACYGQLSELAGMHALSHPVLVAHDLVLKPGQATDGELLRLDPHKKTVTVFLSGFEDACATPAGEIALLRGGVWVYFDVQGHPIAQPVSPLPPPVAPAPASAPASSSAAAPVVVPNTAQPNDPIVPAHLAAQCDPSGAPEFPTFVEIPGGTLARHINPKDPHWTLPNVPGDGWPAYQSRCGFYFTATTITNAMWRRFLREVGQADVRQLPSGFDGPRQPAVMVSYQEASEYAVWLLNYLEGDGGSRVMHVEVPDRLCWEYVARAGRPELQAKFATATGTCLTAAGSHPIVHWKNPQPVDADNRAFAPIVFGGAELYHMGGNVWEWTNDTTSSAKIQRMVCGGSYQSQHPDCLSLDHADFVPDGPHRALDIGFRLFAM